MSARSLLKIFIFLIFAFFLCAKAEAGQSSAKTLRLRVTVPVTFRTQVIENENIKNIRQQDISSEEVFRNNEIVKLKTITQK